LNNFSVLETLVHNIRFQRQSPDWPKLTMPPWNPPAKTDGNALPCNIKCGKSS
jgi:hypothetical protein